MGTSAVMRGIAILSLIVRFSSLEQRIGALLRRPCDPLPSHMLPTV
ncbi:hypothetical protein RIEGSTA812A_PEG_400 [invertebrate metagenome]|uniref:Uncharacterized protein n=1 Tax=invertebrate metagenome TaxID=1711999 RepID=A0A484H504_9ZZZZ